MLLGNHQLEADSGIIDPFSDRPGVLEEYDVPEVGRTIIEFRDTREILPRSQAVKSSGLGRPPAFARRGDRISKCAAHDRAAKHLFEAFDRRPGSKALLGLDVEPPRDSGQGDERAVDQAWIDQNQEIVYQIQSLANGGMAGIRFQKDELLYPGPLHLA